jgi:V8-like Glu-specific endopeptidase
VKKLSTVKRGWIALFVATLVVVSASALVAADRRTTAQGQGVAEMPSQVSTIGLTHEEYLLRQDDLNRKLASEMPSRVMEAPLRADVTPEEIAAVEQAPSRGGIPLQIGLVKPATPRLDIDGLQFTPLPASPRRANSALASRTPDGGFVWARGVTSASAGALRVHIENMSLPPGAELFFHSPGGEAFGPYSGSGPNGDGDFWTETVYGTDGILQLRVAGPAAETDLRGIMFSVTEVGIVLPRFSDAPQAAAGFCGNPTCVVDATCYNVAAANPAKDAVAKMEWIQGAYIYTCTGGLIANASNSNYFLTANHCISKNNSAKNAVFYFRFATSSCNGSCPSNSGWPYKTTGAAVAVTGRKGDFSLLRLNSNPPSGSVKLGWTSAAVANSNGASLYRISNPNFGPQVYSQHNVDTAVGTCSGWPRGERIYSRDITGAIDGGSSGSPVVNGSSQIVGQLSGTCGTNPSDSCGSGPGEANATVDGAFAYYFASVAPFLQ